MKSHLGGPETDEQVLKRHRRYLKVGPEVGQMFAIVLPPGDSGAEEVAVGNIGYWPKEWQDEEVFETGWFVLPEYQGKGIAVAATREVLRAAAADGSRRWVHAYPSVDNLPSNGICLRAGFELVGSDEFEFPPGHFMTCNDWRFDLETIT